LILGHNNCIHIFEKAWKIAAISGFHKPEVDVPNSCSTAAEVQHQEQTKSF